MPVTEKLPAERWGAWKFEPATLTLQLPGAGYQVKLKDIRSSACMLDYIFEVNAMPWASNEITRNLLNAFQDLFDPRMTLCSANRAEPLNPEAHLGRRQGSHGSSSEM